MAASPSVSFSINPLLRRFMPSPLASALAPTLEHVLSIRRLARMYRDMPKSSDPLEFARAALDSLNVRSTLVGALDAIPATGPLVVVANHPFGGIEGLALYAALASRRADVRILGNELLGMVPELRPVLVPVDVLSGASRRTRNAAAMRRALRWVVNGGALIVFPAGEVSSFNTRSGTVEDSPWSPSVARLVRLAKAQVVPVHVDGSTSPLFHLAGLLHPRLRTAMLPREVLNKRRHHIAMTVGRPVSPEQADAPEADRELTELLRLLVYGLAGDRRRPLAASAATRRGALEAIAAPQAPADLAREIAMLEPAQRLLVGNGLEVWHAGGSQVPKLLQEIGRLRELTFRAAGEGTGRSSDVDLFDAYYEQLFIWNPGTLELVGGYGLGRVDRIIGRFGVRGLYTHTLFRYNRAFVDSLGPALELGRSFVRAEYQRGFAPLMLLWKGIAAYVVKFPRYRRLFGPVSISNDYSAASRAVLTGFLDSRHADPVRRPLARPRVPVKAAPGSRIVRRAATQLSDLEAVDRVVASLEDDGKDVPVLIRQYLKLGAKAIAFNLDRDFGNSVDVLVSVDLDALDARTLARYMGSSGAAAFRGG